MVGYISEGFRYFSVAKKHCDLVDEDALNSFVSIVFSAMYIESVINDVIYTDQLKSRLYEEALEKTIQAIELNIYNERKASLDKVHLILQRFKVTGYESDREFIQFHHLMSLRGCLVHLKPVEQVPGGEPDRRICKAALNYLYKNLKIIRNPFGRGVFWTDVLMRKEVAEWALSVAKDFIEWLFQKSYDGTLGNHTLSSHCLRIKYAKSTHEDA